MLANGEIDLGLIPVAAIPDLPQHHIIGRHCIATEGEIASVALFSDVPLDKVDRVYLDYQSRTSAALLQYLIREYWGIQPEIVRATDEGYRDLIAGTTAGLVIGDRAFEQRKRSTYIYDLGSEWRALTGLPFVFAVWVSTRPLPQSFVDAFDAANAIGLSRIDDIVEQEDFRLFDLRKYYRLHLSYQLDDRKRKAIERFLEVM